MGEPPSPTVGTTHSGTHKGRRLLVVGGALAAALLAAATGMAACGGSPDAGSSNPGQGPTAARQSSQAGEVAFAQCVRSHGVPDFPDPQNGHFLVSGSVQNNPNFQPAVQACQHLLPGGSATNGGSGSNSSAELAFAHCMQTHGAPNFPDPSSNGALGVPPGVNANSPQFQSAFHACSSLLPNNGAGLGG